MISLDLKWCKGTHKQSRHAAPTHMRKGEPVLNPWGYVQTHVLTYPKGGPIRPIFIHVPVYVSKLPILPNS